MSLEIQGAGNLTGTKTINRKIKLTQIDMLHVRIPSWKYSSTRGSIYPCASVQDDNLTSFNSLGSGLDNDTIRYDLKVAPEIPGRVGV